ncbi:MAG: (2Fe-2S) ferredoxin domain-containing protein [Pyrinomonadaceae bacterium]
MGKPKNFDAHVIVCTHQTCKRQGAKEALKALKRALKAEGDGRRVLVSKIKCLDQCGRGPVFALYPAGVWYGSVDEAGARKIAGQMREGGRVAAEGLKVLCQLKRTEGAE